MSILSKSIMKIIALADLHFGNPRIDSEELYQKLRHSLYPELGTAHLVFVAGDLYDQLLTVNSKAYKFASLFMYDLMNISAKTGMQVRLLHGTFSHDRDQVDIFETAKIPQSNFKVINQITCEEISNLRSSNDTVAKKLKVGYIPDNLSYRTSDEVLTHLKREMEILNWKELDLVIGHGAFDHVLRIDKEHKPLTLYSISQFQPITPHGLVIMGHIHTPSHAKNVYYCGSFDRMAHNEEESKGYYSFTFDHNTWRAQFHVNTQATLFNTITLQGDDIEELIQSFLDQVNQKFPTKRGYVRVIHANPEVRAMLHRICSQEFPELHYSSKSSQDTPTVEIKVDEVTLDVVNDVLPDEKNIASLVYQYLEDRQLLDQISQQAITQRISALL